LESKAFERLEPCAGKLARTVLRGEGRSNAPLLPGSTQFVIAKQIFACKIVIRKQKKF